MQLDLDPLTLAFVGISREQDIQAFDALDQSNPEWILDWLTYKGLDEWRDYAARCYLNDPHQHKQEVSDVKETV